MRNQPPVLGIVCISFFWMSCSDESKKTTDGKPTSAIENNTTFAQQDQANASTSLATLADAYNQSVTQHFVVPAGKQEVVTGQQGCRVRVDPGALITVDGQPATGAINVQLIELTNSEALFKSNAATMSDGRLLASGGSYYIGMTSEGKALQIKPGAHLQVDLPKLKQERMELFYGQRDAAGNMNWTATQAPFSIRQQYSSNRPYLPPFSNKAINTTLQYKSRFKLHDSLNTTVFFMNQKMTLLQMVTALQKRGVDKNIDSICLTPEEYYGTAYYRQVDPSNTTMIKKYRIISCKDLEGEKDSLSRLESERKTMLEANQRYATEYWAAEQKESLAGKIQSYYAPSSISTLGWINCDRFYDNPTNIDLPVELPYTFNSNSIQYFIIYKNFNGLMSGLLQKNTQGQFQFSRLPNGEKVTIIAFAKNNGQLYQYKEDLVIGAGKKISANFTPVSKQEMQKIFGNNVSS